MGVSGFIHDGTGNSFSNDWSQIGPWFSIVNVSLVTDS